jgi:tetratricopeptide (TPR) repeat protein
MLSAAQDGKRIKEALERALALDAELHDAYFGIGLYHYYADVAPGAAKMLRWLLLLPGGDKTEGMREMLRARGAGQLLRSEADYQLHLIYLWYEKQTPRALDLLRALRDRHPRNPHFPQLIAEIEDTYLKDHAASLRTWQALLEAAREGRVEFGAMTETRARLGVALQHYRLAQHDAALPHLRAVIESNPPAPYGSVSLAHLQSGYVFDRLGRRDEAVGAYRAALATNPPGDPLKIASRARRGLRTPAR